MANTLIYKIDWSVIVYNRDSMRLYTWYSPESEKATKSILQNIIDFKQLYKETIITHTRQVSRETKHFTKLSSQWYAEGAVSDARLGKEIFNALIEDIEGYFADAKYYARRCISTIGYATRFEEDIFRLTAFGTMVAGALAGTGAETLLDVNPSWVRLSNLKHWTKYSKSEKKTVINMLRSFENPNPPQEDTVLRVDCTNPLLTTADDILKYAEDKTYFARKKANRGLPEVCKITIKDFKWLTAHEDSLTTEIHDKLSLYAEYLESMYVQGVDVTQEYWRRHRNWYETARAHRAEARRLSREASKRKLQDSIEKKYANKIIAPQVIDGFTFEITNSFDAWQKQARELHQCIIRCKYYQLKTSTIVFCYKDDAPYATFEVRAHKIVQSYKNEQDRDNMYVEPECTAACEKFIQANNL